MALRTINHGHQSKYWHFRFDCLSGFLYKAMHPTAAWFTFCLSLSGYNQQLIVSAMTILTIRKNHSSSSATHFFFEKDFFSTMLRPICSVVGLVTDFQQRVCRLLSERQLSSNDEVSRGHVGRILWDFLVVFRVRYCCWFCISTRPPAWALIQKRDVIVKAFAACECYNSLLYIFIRKNHVCI